jgi:hypothetical protein
MDKIAFVKNIFACLFLPALLLTAAIASEKPGENPDAFEAYISDGSYFKCLLPKGWSRNETPDYSHDANRVYGIEVYQGSSEQKAGISVKYYAKDNSLHKSAERFINAHSRPVFGGQEGEGEKYGLVKEILIKGVKAKTFERVRYEFEDHVLDSASGRQYEPINPRKFPMTERFIVIPAKEGYYVLRYKASTDAVKSLEGIFQRVSDSFEMSVK